MKFHDYFLSRGGRKRRAEAAVSSSRGVLRGAARLLQKHSPIVFYEQGRTEAEGRGGCLIQLIGGSSDVKAESQVFSDGVKINGSGQG
eukprot:CAMPEP_0174757034 /NCGR_PEP_ID=MMETSP1094-20130205/107058_1 /TAXON_ID=156173 /ORGANISM="Chrysochromulina brevifilum, Strain UTEX LB 985" /LENGTH=87 /DNA_ID=CAMNT_0015962951 /DNA_START=262 /DNA_END=525 /DNA_ORIENTATION=+